MLPYKQRMITYLKQNTNKSQYFKCVFVQFYKANASVQNICK